MIKPDVNKQKYAEKITLLGFQNLLLGLLKHSQDFEVSMPGFYERLNGSDWFYWIFSSKFSFEYEMLEHRVYPSLQILSEAVRTFLPKIIMVSVLEDVSIQGNLKPFHENCY